MQARIIPVLTIRNGALVKSVKFKNHAYIGDPINAVRIFNEKEVTEIALVDISTTSGPDFARIKSIVSEAFVPVAYGGGVTSIEQMKKIFKLGVEKILVNTAAFTNSTLVSEAVKIFGSQSIVVVVDYKKNWLGKPLAMVKNGTEKTDYSPLQACLAAEKMGAGEIVLQSIDHDGEMNGYDHELIKTISTQLNVPLIALGGASSDADLVNVIKTSHASAAAAGSLFVFHGPHKAVLIKYPNVKSLMNGV